MAAIWMCARDKLNWSEFGGIYYLAEFLWFNSVGARSLLGEAEEYLFVEAYSHLPVKQSKKPAQLQAQDCSE